MVFKSLTLFARSKGPDEFWRKRRIFRIASHFDGRRRNCYSLAIRGVHRALSNATLGRKLKKEQMKELWQTRLEAACREHGIPAYILSVGLSRCEILISKKTLVDLAMWEPRSFKSLVNIAWARAKTDGLNLVKHLDFPAGVITQGMMKAPLRSVTTGAINPNAGVITRHMIK